MIAIKSKNGRLEQLFRGPVIASRQRSHSATVACVRCGRHFEFLGFLEEVRPPLQSAVKLRGFFGRLWKAKVSKSSESCFDQAKVRECHRTVFFVLTIDEAKQQVLGCFELIPFPQALRQTT